MPPTDRCYWVERGRLLAGAYPGSAHEAEHRARIAALLDAGLRTFLSLMEDHEQDRLGRALRPYAPELEALARERGQSVAVVRHPIVDLGVPTLDEMRAILDAIDGSLAAGRPVYVHCFGGIGRTGTVVGCWLLRHGLARRDDALEVLAKLRRADVARRSFRSPEAPAQIRFVQSWRQ